MIFKLNLFFVFLNFWLPKIQFCSNTIKRKLILFIYSLILIIFLLSLTLFKGFINLFEDFKAIDIRKHDPCILHLNHRFIKSLEYEVSLIQNDSLLVKDQDYLVFEEGKNHPNEYKSYQVLEKVCDYHILVG